MDLGCQKALPDLNLWRHSCLDAFSGVSKHGLTRTKELSVSPFNFFLDGAAQTPIPTAQKITSGTHKKELPAIHQQKNVNADFDAS